MQSLEAELQERDARLREELKTKDAELKVRDAEISRLGEELSKSRAPSKGETAKVRSMVTIRVLTLAGSR